MDYISENKGSNEALDHLQLLCLPIKCLIAINFDKDPFTPATFAVRFGAIFEGIIMVQNGKKISEHEDYKFLRKSIKENILHFCRRITSINRLFKNICDLKHRVCSFFIPNYK